MSVYKVPQDVEAEDKLIGPLTFRKLAFAGVMAMALGTAYLLARIPPKPFWGIIPMPIAFAFGLLAFYPSKDQPVEVILAAKIRFMFKPRRRIWDQRGVKQLVTITVPRREQKRLTKGYSGDEVTSRLSALAKTLDSRGWAVKNVNLNTFTQPAYASGPSDQRLISPSVLPQTMLPPIDIQAADDILDHTSNPVAQHFDSMMTRAAEEQRKVAIERMQQAAKEPPAFEIPAQPTVHQKNSRREPVGLHYNEGRHAVGNPQNAGYATFGATTLDNPRQSNSVGELISPEEEAFLENIRKQLNESKPVPSNMKRIKTPEEIVAEEAEERAKAEQAAEANASAPAKKTSKHKTESRKEGHTEKSTRISNAQQQTENQTLQNAPEPSPDTSNPAILELANNDDLNIDTLARQAKVASDKLDDGEVVISLR